VLDDEELRAEKRRVLEEPGDGEPPAARADGEGAARA
jgi:hypothetical protein